MPAPLNLSDGEGAAVFSLLDGYLRSEATGDDLPHLRSVREKLNRLWGFHAAETLGAGDAVDLDRR